MVASPAEPSVKLRGRRRTEGRDHQVSSLRDIANLKVSGEIGVGGLQARFGQRIPEIHAHIPHRVTFQGYHRAPDTSRSPPGWSLPGAYRGQQQRDNCKTACGLLGHNILPASA